MSLQWGMVRSRPNRKNIDAARVGNPGGADAIGSFWSRSGWNGV